MVTVMKEQQAQGVQALAGTASRAGSCFEVKVLAVDVDKRRVDCLAHAAPGHTASMPRLHTGASDYILKGMVTKAVRRDELRAGDLGHPPAGDEHQEATGPHGAMDYLWRRGPRDLMAASLDRDTLQKFTARMGQVLTTSAGAPAWN